MLHPSYFPQISIPYAIPERKYYSFNKISSLWKYENSRNIKENSFCYNLEN